MFVPLSKLPRKQLGWGWEEATAHLWGSKLPFPLAKPSAASLHTSLTHTLPGTQPPRSHSAQPAGPA